MFKPLLLSLITKNYLNKYERCNCKQTVSSTDALSRAALPISGAPEQGCRTIPTTFYLLKIYLTEQL
jgi:hypothetical protein